MLRLADLEGPLDDVEFPDGSVHTPIPFGPAEYKLWREVQHEQDATKRGHALLTIIRGCYPTATDENIESCTVRMVWAMIGHAARKIDIVRDALKNVAAAEEPAPPANPQPPAVTTPSSQNTSGNTSSRSSRKRAAKTGGAPTTANPTDGPSSSGTPSTASTTAGESTPYAVNWTTSTAPSSPPTP